MFAQNKMSEKCHRPQTFLVALSSNASLARITRNGNNHMRFFPCNFTHQCYDHLTVTKKSPAIHADIFIFSRYITSYVPLDKIAGALTMKLPFWVEFTANVYAMATLSLPEPSHFILNDKNATLIHIIPSVGLSSTHGF